MDENKVEEPATTTPAQPAPEVKPEAKPEATAPSAPAQAAAPAEPAKGGSKAWLWIILVIVILGAVYYFFLR
jgi:uncharacterized protein HemX